MREDLTGFALGGNKVRKLDFLLGDALAKHADTLVVAEASSFSRNAAAAGKVFGMDVAVLVSGAVDEQNPISHAFFKQFDAPIHFVPADVALPFAQAQLCEQLTAQGHRVYELHPGGSDAIGTLGYVKAFEQIPEVFERSGVHFDRIIHASGPAATQAGLAVGSAISGYDTDLVGIAISQPASVQQPRVHDLAVETAGMLGIAFDRERITVDDRFLGEGYPLPSHAGEAAAALFATKEGLLLDQVYGGKAAAALIAYAKDDAASAQRTLFIHTGGNAGLYY
jgi:1-aminocyclopropane-1-carboxylate deaminase/D-cysteine desulfhydrase-like pyridoxal-dependent ACC family enzyme